MVAIRAEPSTVHPCGAHGRQREIVTGESHATSQSGLKRAEQERERIARQLSTVLHVTNGDSAAREIRRTGLEGVVLPWRDVLHEGPVPGGVTDDELRHIRARFIAGRVSSPFEDVLRDFAARDEMLDGHRNGSYVLWFEADMYDQLQLVQVLARLHELRVPPKNVSLICIGEFPDIAHFGGLGELTAADLAGLYEQREVVRQETLDLAALAWKALRGKDPRCITDIATWRSRQLRFLADAFGRLAREYPWQSDGLSLCQRRILAAVAGGRDSMHAIFMDIADRERRPYLGDTWCFEYIRELAASRHPLITRPSEGDDSMHASGIQLTEAGHKVLFGELDHVALNGLNRWIGGVHLQSDAHSWRYDDRIESILEYGESPTGDQ